MKRTGAKRVVRRSAGLVMYRKRRAQMEVLLVHPGGPFWKKKDLGAWSIPKGEYADGEDALVAAQREFQEELGIAARGEFLALGEIQQKGGKIVIAWGFEGDCEAEKTHSNSFSMEWPPKSGKMQEFPEVDRAEWFGLDEARVRILNSQAELLDRLEKLVGSGKK